MNSRHKKFCEGIVAGKSNQQAYADAGYESTGSVASAAATRLLKNVKIENRISAMLEKTESETIKTVKERKEMLSRIMDKAESGENYQDAIRASSELSKMDGGYEPQKQEANTRIIIGGDADVA